MIGTGGAMPSKRKPEIIENEIKKLDSDMDRLKQSKKISKDDQNTILGKIDSIFKMLKSS